MNEDFEFGDRLPGFTRAIAEERWFRAREEIVFRDLVGDLLVRSRAGYDSGAKVISCPFHGSDSTPSFQFYDQNNSAFCFGCPPPVSNQAYDNISFVAKFFDINKVEALKWIERRYKLPPIADERLEEDEDESDEHDDLFTVEDLLPEFMKTAPTLIRTVGDARHLLRAYFSSIKEENPLFLARILGQERLRSIHSSPEDSSWK